MNWNDLKKEFKEKFPDWTIKISPPCISSTRYTLYYYDVLAYALGKKSTIQGYFDTDKTNKIFTLFREKV